MQRMLAVLGGEDAELMLPPAQDEAMPGVRWGRFDGLFTPAYWKGQAWLHGPLGTYEPGPLGRDLREEVAACMLGGFGIGAEVGLAAFARVKERGLLGPSPDVGQMTSALEEPFFLHGVRRRYRFWRTKAESLAAAMRLLDDTWTNLEVRVLRDALACLPGVGPKTASWVVRNRTGSDHVAILDVHIARAGTIAGLWNSSATPSRSYQSMEAAFLRFAEAIDVRASVLDGLMWDQMRRLGSLAREAEVFAADRYPATPMAAVPQPTMSARPGNKADANPVPSGPRAQKPRPAAEAQRCKVARRAPASLQSRLPGLA